jgi:hypothetical protein
VDADLDPMAVMASTIFSIKAAISGPDWEPDWEPLRDGGVDDMMGSVAGGGVAGRGATISETSEKKASSC